jgi:predicted transcriptional regulator
MIKEKEIIKLYKKMKKDKEKIKKNEIIVNASQMARVLGTTKANISWRLKQLKNKLDKVSN